MDTDRAGVPCGADRGRTSNNVRLGKIACGESAIVEELGEGVDESRVLSPLKLSDLRTDLGGLGGAPALCGLMIVTACFLTSTVGSADCSPTVVDSSSLSMGGKLEG